ncbi:MAG TPA: hypothetical protein VF475_16380 [Sphingobium sp.]
MSAQEEDAGKTARLTQFSVRRLDGGTPGYRLDNPFGQSVQVMPKPPAFRATVTFEWDGAMPEEVEALMIRARTLGIATGE